MVIFHNIIFFSEESSVCLSSSCIYTASEVIRALDEKQDPCDDFYEFACGGWIRNNPIPEGKSSWGIFSKIELQNQLIIRSAIGKIQTYTLKSTYRM